MPLPPPPVSKFAVLFCGGRTLQILRTLFCAYLGRIPPCHTYTLCHHHRSTCRFTTHHFSASLLPLLCLPPLPAFFLWMDTSPSPHCTLPAWNLPLDSAPHRAGLHMGTPTWITLLLFLFHLSTAHMPRIYWDACLDFLLDILRSGLTTLWIRSPAVAGACSCRFSLYACQVSLARISHLSDPGFHHSACPYPSTAVRSLVSFSFCCHSRLPDLTCTAACLPHLPGFVYYPAPVYRWCVMVEVRTACAACYRDSYLTTHLSYIPSSRCVCSGHLPVVMDTTVGRYHVSPAFHLVRLPLPTVLWRPLNYTAGLYCSSRLLHLLPAWVGIRVSSATCLWITFAAARVTGMVRSHCTLTCSRACLPPAHRRPACRRILYCHTTSASHRHTALQVRRLPATPGFTSAPASASGFCLFRRTSLGCRSGLPDYLHRTCTPALSYLFDSRTRCHHLELHHLLRVSLLILWSPPPLAQVFPCLLYTPAPRCSSPPTCSGVRSRTACTFLALASPRCDPPLPDAGWTFTRSPLHTAAPSATHTAPALPGFYTCHLAAFYALLPACLP